MEIKETKTKLLNYVYLKDNFLPESGNKALLKIAKNFIEYEDATIVGRRTTDYIKKNIRSTKIKFIKPTSEKMTEVFWYNYFKVCFARMAVVYANEVQVKKTPSPFDGRIQDLAILKYSVGDFYTVHIDHGSSTPRSLSLVYFLNDNFEGGELVFLSPDHKQECIVYPKKNRLIMWPSNFLYPHTIKKVTKGERYTIVSWII